jgi:uncharacterized membrane protein YeaQ/YmgE (transglycosylase-associated protein family)
MAPKVPTQGCVDTTPGVVKLPLEALRPPHPVPRVSRRRIARAGTATRAYSKDITMLGLIITIIVVGAIAGFLARLIVPGRQDLSVVATIVLGIIGSFVGGLLGYLLFGKDANNGFLQPSGIIGSIIGAIVVLLVWTATQGRNTARR